MLFRKKALRCQNFSMSRGDEGLVENCGTSPRGCTKVRQNAGIGQTSPHGAGRSTVRQDD